MTTSERQPKGGILGRLLAENRALWQGPARRMVLVKWAVCAALLSGMGLCPRLWTSDRVFPTIPAIQGLPDLPQPVCLALVFLLVASVLLTAVLPRPGPAIVAVLVLGGALVLFDIARLQPWFYQYMLLLAGLALMQWEQPESARSKSAWAVCGLILAATYFWSGLQKVNLTFADSVFPWLLQPFGLDRLQPLWFLAPVVETAVGVLLVIPRARVWGLAAGFAMHAFLLAVLGPFGQNFNAVVWPWNLWMPSIAFILFFRSPDLRVDWAWRSAVGKAIGVLVVLMPALSFFGLWDAYLSASLYSGKPPAGFIFLTDEGEQRLPSEQRAYVRREGDRIAIDISAWSLSALGVPPYAEIRVYKALARRVRDGGVPESEMRLVVVAPGDPLRSVATPRVVSID